jgi:hypothetical protein
VSYLLQVFVLIVASNDVLQCMPRSVICVLKFMDRKLTFTSNFIVRSG